GDDGTSCGWSARPTRPPRGSALAGAWYGRVRSPGTSGACRGFAPRWSPGCADGTPPPSSNVPTPQAACGCDYAGSGGDRPSGGPSTPDGSPDGGQLPTVWRLRASFTAGGTISATTSRPYSTNAIGLENSTPTSP